MKRNIIFFAALCLISMQNTLRSATLLNSQSKFISKDSSLSSMDAFKSTLLSVYDDFDTSKTFSDMVTASNKMKLVAGKWSEQWTAQYYAGYMLTVLSFIEKDEAKRDSYLDEAENYFKKAKELFKKNSDEMYVLAAMIANARLAVKPGSRYKKYGEIFSADLDSARNLNDANPRIYYLKGNSIFYTPKIFGGGAKKALPYFEIADTLYQKEKSSDIFKPYWGNRQNADLLKKCKE